MPAELARCGYGIRCKPAFTEAANRSCYAFSRRCLLLAPPKNCRHLAYTPIVRIVSRFCQDSVMTHARAVRGVAYTPSSANTGPITSGSSTAPPSAITSLPNPRGSSTTRPTRSPSRPANGRWGQQTSAMGAGAPTITSRLRWSNRRRTKRRGQRPPWHAAPPRKKC